MEIMRWANTEPSMHFRKTNADPSMHFRKANTDPSVHSEVFLFLYYGIVGAPESNSFFRIILMFTIFFPIQIHKILAHSVR